MKVSRLPLVRVGKSRGVRLPAKLLRRYHITDAVKIETLPDGIVLRRPQAGKLSWKATYRQMASAKEGWSDWDTAAADGLNED